MPGKALRMFQTAMIINPRHRDLHKLTVKKVEQKK